VAKELAAALMSDPQDKAKVAKLQITCKVCHWEKAIRPQARRGAAQGGVIYGTKSGAHDDKIFAKMGEERHPQAGDLPAGSARHRPELRVRLPVQWRDRSTAATSITISPTRPGHLPGVHSRRRTASRPPHRPELRRQGVDPEALASTNDLMSRHSATSAAQGGDAYPEGVVNTKLSHTAGHRIPMADPGHNRVVMW